MTQLNLRPQTDALLVELTRYALEAGDFPEPTLGTARLVLADSLGCAALASTHETCRPLLGPVVPGTIVPNGARVPATPYELDPVEAAFQTGALIRWLDYNDTWLAAEWGHPSDNLGAILAIADYLARSGQPVTVADVLDAAVIAHEIQGVLALDNAFNRVGLDHVILVKVASTAAVARLLGLDENQLAAALSNAWIDGHPLRTYRHAPNRPLGTFVMDNVLFKAFPAEFHAQTAAECALRLHPQVRDRLDDIARIEIRTQEPALRIIDKTGPLHNPADRDHSLQYVTVVALVYGDLTDRHYEDEVAADPRIDRLLGVCFVREEARYTRDYLEPSKRSIGNAVRIVFADGSSTELIEVEYPLGHPRRRGEVLPLLREKLRTNLAKAYGERAGRLTELLLDDPQLPALPVDELMGELAAR